MTIKTFISLRSVAKFKLSAASRGNYDGDFLSVKTIRKKIIRLMLKCGLIFLFMIQRGRLPARF